jgi:dihydroxy-acid dehydratase
MGWSDEDYRNKPVIAILNTWSDLNTCHSHLKQRADEVKRGVWQAGGFPVEVPVMSLGEMLMKPTTMLYRNLLAMEVEEVIRCHPVDGVVLMGGCDKTVPGLLMGAITANVPAIFFPAGPMLKARWRDQTLGSGSDAWKFWAERCAGNLCDEDWQGIENSIARSPGVCMTMGTASTMAAIAEALGMILPGGSSVPAVVSEHSRLAASSGRRIVEMVWQDLKPRDILNRAAFENAVVTDMALSGSTNALVHLLALSRRACCPLTMDDFDRLSRATPVLANIRPTGKYLMEDFFDAGGLRALLANLRDHLQLDCLNVNGLTLGENLAGAEVFDADVIRTCDTPVAPSGGTYVLRGNLSPHGCVIKPAAADPRLRKHRGPAVVFRDYNDLKARLNDESTPITADSVIVLQSAGPLGAPGFPEWGMLPIPDRLLRQGVRDMVRISDARMSGTSYGTCVLHVSPESHVGGPLAWVKDGDLIELDVDARRLDLLVDADELQRRQQSWTPPPPKFRRGYGQIFSRHVTQAHEGCDFDFLECDGMNDEPEIH